MITRVGFTGSQRGLNDAQRETIKDLLVVAQQQGAKQFHHGGCTGADEQAAMIAGNLGYETFCWRGDTPDKQSTFVSSVTYDSDPPTPNLERNHYIVDVCDVLIAGPGQDAEIRRSGTWATLRYAASIARTHVIVTPDGQLGAMA